MTRAELHRGVAGLDPARALEFELAATHLARRLGEPALEGAIEAAGDPDEPEAVRLFAVAVAVALCRRLHRREDAQRALLALGHGSDGRPLVVHLRSLVSMLVGTDEAVHDAVETAEVACRELPDNPGVVHTLAWALVEAAERDGLPPDDPTWDRALDVARRRSTSSGT